MTRNAVKHWVRQGTIHLDLLLLASWCVRLKPVDLFAAEDPVAKVRLDRWQRSGAGQRGTRWVRRDRRAVGRQFDEIVRVTPAVRLGVDTALPRERCPEHVAALTSRWRTAPGSAKPAKVIVKQVVERQLIAINHKVSKNS